MPEPAGCFEGAKDKTALIGRRSRANIKYSREKGLPSGGVRAGCAPRVPNGVRRAESGKLQMQTWRVGLVCIFCV